MTLLSGDTYNERPSIPGYIFRDNFISLPIFQGLLPRTCLYIWLETAWNISFPLRLSCVSGAAPVTVGFFLLLEKNKTLLPAFSRHHRSHFLQNVNTQWNSWIPIAFQLKYRYVNTTPIKNHINVPVQAGSRWQCSRSHENTLKYIEYALWLVGLSLRGSLS